MRGVVVDEEGRVEDVGEESAKERRERDEAVATAKKCRCRE